MGYIEKNLMDGEQIVYRAEMHWIVYWLPALLALIGIVQFVIPTEKAGLMVQIALCVILLIAALIGAVKVNGGRQYVLTNKRVIAKRGIITRDSLELMLRKCEGVKISQSIMGRILNYGTVMVTTGEATDSFDYIKDPIRFSTQIHQQIDNLKSFS